MYVTGLAAWAASSGMKLSWPAARKISTSSAVRPPGIARTRKRSTFD